MLIEILAGIGLATVILYGGILIVRLVKKINYLLNSKHREKYWIGQYNKAEDMYEEKVDECDMLENENRKLKAEIKKLVKRVEDPFPEVFVDKSEEEINNIFGEPKRRSAEYYDTTQEEIDEMFKLVQKLSNIMTQKEIAEKIDTCPTNVNYIANRRIERNASLGKFLPKLRELAEKYSLLVDIKN